MKQWSARIAFCLAVSLPLRIESRAQAAPMATEPGTSQQQVLTLSDAETRALKHRPLLLADHLRAQAAGKSVVETKAQYFPQLYGNLTAVQANGDTAVAAGNVTTSSVSSRAAAGATLMQMITDFGRTSNLVQSASLTRQAAGQTEESARQTILLEVDEAYFATEAAESVRKTAQAVLDFRRVSLRQLTALAQSQLRSTLDVQFAEVLVSEAEMALVRAESSARKARAQLAASMGEDGETNYTLVDGPLPAEPDPEPASYLNAAIASRPELKALRLRSDSARHYAQAERDLNYPTVDALGTAGEIPIHDSTLHRDYGAIGVNINVPIFNGRLFSARAAEAKLDAAAADQDAAEQQVQITREVRSSWADARDAFEEIEVAQRLVGEANTAMHLAQARYDAGLGSIVELNQAELNQTSALITAASTRYNYLRAIAALQYAVGDLH
jgi:outer membrane protein